MTADIIWTIVVVLWGIGVLTGLAQIGETLEKILIQLKLMRFK